MSHSGCNGGKKWRIKVIEKCGSAELEIFDTKKEAEKLWGKQSEDCTQGMRPVRATDLLEDWLKDRDTFPYEAHGMKVVGQLFNRPLVFGRKK